MTREQLDKSLKECQHRLIVGVPVHEQDANDMVHSAFQSSLGNF